MKALFRSVAFACVALAAIRAWKVTAYEAQFREGVRAYERGAYAVAVERFEAARMRSDRDPLLWTWLGDAAAATHQNPPQGGWPAAREEALLTRIWSGYAGAVLRGPRDSWSWSGLADAALRRARNADAAVVLDLGEIERRRTGTFDPWRAAALGAARIALDLKPSGFLELDVLAAVHESAGQTDAAREAYIRSARMMPAPAFHSWSVGRRIFAKPLYEGIRDGLRDGLSRAPEFDRSMLHLGIGRFALTQADLETAEVEMRRAQEAALTEHDRYHALRGLAETLERAGRLEEAASALTRALPFDVNPAADRIQRGGIYHRMGRKAEACDDLSDAAREYPDDAGLHAFAAVACEEAGEVEIAERLLRESFSTPVADPVLARGLLDFYVRQGRLKTAGGLARKWSRDFPDRRDLAAWAEELETDEP